MNYKPFSLLEIDGSYSLTAEAGFRNDFFNSYNCQSTGDILDAIVRYILRTNDVDIGDFEFDSETGAFVMYCSDEEKIRKAAEILSREINQDDVLSDAMASDEVIEELDYSRRISETVSKVMSESDASLSPDEFLAKFNELFSGK